MKAQVKGLRAQALIEFTFILPVMLLVMFAIVDGSVLLRTSMACRSAAEEGARAIAQEHGDIAAGAIAATARQSVSGSDADGMTVTTEPVSDEVVRFTMEVPDSGKPGLATSRRMVSQRVTCSKSCKLMIAGLFGADEVQVSESAISSYASVL